MKEREEGYYWAKHQGENWEIYRWKAGFFYSTFTSMAYEEKYFDNMVKSYRLYISCFRGEGNRDGGYVIGTAMNHKGQLQIIKLWPGSLRPSDQSF